MDASHHNQQSWFLFSFSVVHNVNVPLTTIGVLEELESQTVAHTKANKKTCMDAVSRDLWRVPSDWGVSNCTSESPEQKYKFLGSTPEILIQ